MYINGDYRGDERAAEALKIGIEQGHYEKAIEATKKLLKENIAPDIIARCVGLPLEKVLELKKGK